MNVLLGHFSSRIWASSITWFVNDFAFYGNKLFQGVFIKIINPHANLIQVSCVHTQPLSRLSTGQNVHEASRISVVCTTLSVFQVRLSTPEMICLARDSQNDVEHTYAGA